MPKRRLRLALDGKFPFCSHVPMNEINEDRVAKAILAAPGWARVGISAPKESTREAAAQELALTITKMFGDRPPASDPNQLVLAL